MSRHNRRDFLKRSAAAGFAATFAVSGAKASGKILGANDRVRIAVVGINSRGQGHIHNYCRMKNVEVAYLVDPDSRLFPMRSRWVKDHAGNKPKCVQDLREALEDNSLDAISIASPNHWHSLQAIWACQAGKDVYVEKPCSHNIFEGRKLVEAARKYNRIVQQGSQSRSDPDWIATIEAVRGGEYGKLLIAYGYASKPRRSIGFKLPKTPPKEVDFNLWLGPAPQQPYHENLVHYNWHWFWDFGNGEIGNQGVHQMDIARWAMPEGAVPRSVISLGGRYGYQTQDQGQTPNTQFTVIDFGGPKLFFEDRGLVDKKTRKVTNEFYTDEGVIKGGKFYAKGKTVGEPLPGGAVDEARKRVTLSGRLVNPDGKRQDPTKLHFANFIDCVRSRQRDQLRAEILEGHRSTELCHLGNLSYQLGKETSFNRGSKPFGDDQDAQESFESMKEHLTDAVRMRLEGATYRLGRKLAFDAAADRFIGDDEANELLTRPYRHPFVVPEQV
ncbi:MAG: Gfo/Idh/MocA family oxidoreductase [Pirellulales bacterium]|nr:Gfo/Idh/MocA family oxidoreductase [Pirellulales bacterium]